MVIAASLLLFAISSIGFWELLQKYSKVDVLFLPSLTIAVQVGALFVGGLLNLLPEVTYLLYAAGFFGFAVSAYQAKSLVFLKKYCNIGFLFLAAMALFVLLRLPGQRFIAYDNFSHWALVVKCMLETNRFPNFQDTLIAFKDYPLGSSVYIYFFAKLVGTAEPIQMFAQAYTILASIVPVFFFAKRNRWAAFALTVVTTHVILGYNIGLQDLSVDTLLPMVAVAAMLYFAVYCRSTKQPAAFFLGGFYLVQLMQIKNSGIFFVLMILVGMFVTTRSWQRAGWNAMVAAMPLLSSLLWKKHTAYVFSKASTSKHAMTLENYSAVFAGKTPEQIKSICRDMLIFTVSWVQVWMVFAVLAVVAVLWIVYNKKQRKQALQMLLGAVAVYAVYQLCTLAMYLFSMPIGEALVLASHERYAKTILGVFLMLALVMLVKLLSELTAKKSVAFSTALATASLLGYVFVAQIQPWFEMKVPDSMQKRIWLETIQNEYQLPVGESYFVLHPEDKSFLRYMCRYVLSSEVKELVNPTVEDLNKISSKYILVYQNDSQVVDEWIKENFPDQYGNPVIIRENIA